MRAAKFDRQTVRRASKLLNLRYQSNYKHPDSLAYKQRMKRREVFESFFMECFKDELQNHAKIKILDVGGTYAYWKTIAFSYFEQCDITLLNLTQSKVPDNVTNVHSVIGNATDMKEIPTSSFDFVFSNSCIEHVGKELEWKKTASEIARIGKYYYLQTPNRYFVLEPHFLFPLFQLYPLKLRAALVHSFKLGHYPKANTWQDAMNMADSIRLLSYNDLKRLFPSGQIKREKLFGMTKSFMVMGKCQ